MFTDDVAAAIREVAAAEVTPRFRALAKGDIAEKSPGDFVTIADRECERVLSERLRQIRDIPVVGEEGTTEDPNLLDLIATETAVWILDPIDGTRNFVNGEPGFVVMVALVEAGVTIGAWVWHPGSESMLTAALGEGTHRDGNPIPPAARSDEPTGIVHTNHVPEPGRSTLRGDPSIVGHTVPKLGSAGIEYTRLIDGDLDFLFYWRTLPWDHAPCALLATEAGMVVARHDGSPYEPGDGKAGLLIATPQAWDQVYTGIQAALAE